MILYLVYPEISIQLSDALILALIGRLEENKC